MELLLTSCVPQHQFHLFLQCLYKSAHITRQFDFGAVLHQVGEMHNVVKLGIERWEVFVVGCFLRKDFRTQKSRRLT